MLILAGLIDLTLGMMPLQFGVPEWEFGAIGNFYNRLPLFALGLTLALGGSLARSWTKSAILLSSLLLLTSLVVLVLGLFFATNFPVVLRAAGNEALRTAVLKATAKAGVQVAVFAPVFLGAAVYGIRAAIRAGRRRR